MNKFSSIIIFNLSLIGRITLISLIATSTGIIATASAGTPSCHPSFSDSKHRLHRHSKRYRCCTPEPQTIPDGSHYGGNWCQGEGSVLKIVAVNSCAYHSGQARTSLRLPDTLWECVKSSIKPPLVVPQPQKPLPAHQVPCKQSDTLPLSPDRLKLPQKIADKVIGDSQPLPPPPPPRSPSGKARDMGPRTFGSYEEERIDALVTDERHLSTSLAYPKMDDSASIDEFLQNLKDQTGPMKDRPDIVPQIALESKSMGLRELDRELSNPKSETQMNVRRLARALAEHPERQFNLRPLSELNDGAGAWQYENPLKKGNDPKTYSAVWLKLRSLFDQEGAKNARFIFDVVAGHFSKRTSSQESSSERRIHETLNLIPAGAIDAFGMNVYTRPRLSAVYTHAEHGKPSDFIPFGELASPWMKMLRQTHHNGIPFAAPEVGVSDGVTKDKMSVTASARAAWLKDAFQFAKKNDFKTFVYFNDPGGRAGWQIPADQNEADKVLSQGSTLLR